MSYFATLLASLPATRGTRVLHRRTPPRVVLFLFFFTTVSFLPLFSLSPFFFPFSPPPSPSVVVCWYIPSPLAASVAPWREWGKREGWEEKQLRRKEEGMDDGK